MTDEPKQVDKDDGQGRSDLHNKWLGWTIAFLCILLGIVVALFVATTLFDPFDALKSAWRWYFRSEPNPSMTERKDLVLGVATVIQAFAVLVAGLVALAGLYFTQRTLLHNQETLRTNQENTQRTLDLTEQGQITERFTRAIDQLGATDNEGKNKKLEIRLGGIYALERIAWDSLTMENSPGRDYSTVMEVLTAYVRENTPQALGPSEGPSGEFSPFYPLRRWFRSTAKAEEGAEQAAPLEPCRPTADIQTILNVLTRTQARVPEESRIPEEYHIHLDLHEANLRGANLQGANLQGANLQGANLQGANLIGAFSTDEQLADALSLQGATMPDGSEHP